MFGTLAGALLLIPSPTAAETAAIERLLADMRSAYRQIKSARVVVRVSARRIPNNLVFKTTTIYQAPDKIFIERDRWPEHQIKPTVTVNGKTIRWVRRDGQVVVEEFNGQNIRWPVNLETLCIWDHQRQLTIEGGNMEDSYLRILPSEVWQGRTWIVLDETSPKTKNTVRYLIDPKTKLIGKCVVRSLDRQHTYVTTELIKLEQNVRVPKGSFQLLAM